MPENVPELRIQFAKQRDGDVILRCRRRNDSVTWQRHPHQKHAAFFSFHDLSHLAVETTLGFRSGFYGLIADGWDIADTTGKGTRGKLMPASILVEHVVGLFDRELAGGAGPLTAAEFNAHVDEVAGCDALPAPLMEEQLQETRRRIAELHRQWAATPAGSMLELTFDRGDNTRH